MDTKNGTEGDDLIRTLKDRDGILRFDFFQLVRLIETRWPGSWARFGESRAPAEDPVRFGQRPHLGLAASTVAAFEPADGLRPPQVTVNFFGLLGPHGPMPLHLTEHALHRLRQPVSDGGFVGFLDVFHHRLICFFYRAWAIHQQVLELDRASAAGAGERETFRRFVGSFIGRGSTATDNDDEAIALAQLHFAGRLAYQGRDADGLKIILQDFFGVAVRIQQNFGRWVHAHQCQDEDPEGFCALGESPSTGTLGQSLMIGARFWDAQCSFRVRLGPLTLEEFLRFLPGADSSRRLNHWVNGYTGQEFCTDVQLVLRANAVPDTLLGESGALGLTIWLKSGEAGSRPAFTHDADVGSSRVDLQACKLEYSIVSPK